MNKLKQKSGFTLLEIIIVIIIVGVLASLALPRFFRTVEYSRSMEALTHLANTRQAMQRCYLLSNTYGPCTTFAALDVDDPATIVGSHFTYTTPFTVAATTFTITAVRNTLDNSGPGGDNITIDQDGRKTGTGAFSNIR